MVTIRVDDVNPNTDFRDLNEQIHILNDVSDDIILGINIFGRDASNGAVYPDLPLRDQDNHYFYKINRLFHFSVLHDLRNMRGVRIASHGLLHNMHSKMSRETIEYSVLASCNILDSKIFIPPFNDINKDLMSVCEENGIELIMNKHDVLWRSLETDKFDPTHKHWYYHPWRLTSKQLKEILH